MKSTARLEQNVFRWATELARLQARTAWAKKALVVDSIGCSDWEQRGGDDASLPLWSLAPPWPSHDRYSSESTGLGRQTRHCTVSLYVTSSLAASLSLPAVTNSQVKPATDHRSGVEPDRHMTCPLTPLHLTHRCHTMTCKRAVNIEHTFYDIGYISRVSKFAQGLKFKNICRCKFLKIRSPHR